VEEVQTAESAQSASQAPVDHGSPDTSASNQTPGLDELLSQYDTVTEAQKDVADTLNQIGPQPDPLDELLPEFQSPSDNPLQGQLDSAQQQNKELTGALRQMQFQQLRAEDQRAFDEFTKSIQESVSPNLPDTWAAAEVKAALHDPALRFAFDARHLDQNAVRADLERTEAALSLIAGASPTHPLFNDPRRQATINHLTELREKLLVAVHHDRIINKFKRDLIDRGRKHRVVHEEVTADVLAVRQAIMQGSSGGKIPDGPPPDYSTMGRSEFESEKRKLFRR
jgi:hypothetical protein